MSKQPNILKKFWAFLQKDTWLSLIVTLIIAFVVIKYIFFPLLSLATGTSLPLVIVESCSMHHYQGGFEQSFTSPVYANKGINLNDTKNWIFQNGFNKGDVIFVVGPKNIHVGDVIIFQAGAANPIIHRVISINDGIYSTKGDNHLTNAGQLPSEMSINQDQIIGKALFKVPFVGWAKLIFFEWSRAPTERGLC